MIRVLQGDARKVLATLPAASVQCCVTSPPYFNLRDYGTGTWEGGDAACDHRKVVDPLAGIAKSGLEGGKKTNGHQQEGFRERCGRCGAARIDAQIGNEATPDAYIAGMVAVFREVKRVLRNDGICFLNLGDSYCSATQNMLYVLREDLTVTELQRVALAVFGVRVTGDEEACERAVSYLLRQGIQGEAICAEPPVEGGRKQGQLPTSPRGGYSEDDSAPQADEDRGDKCAGRQVRMLQRDDTAIPDIRSHPRGRRSSSEATDWQEPIFVGPNISRGAETGISEGSVSRPLLQLQLRDRFIRLLSSRQFAETEIPTSVRACFKATPGVKPKDLMMMPARVALALQADGWWLRSDIIWAKPNPMPESVTDRPTSSHEHVFLLTKSARYFFDAEAVREAEAVPNWDNGTRVFGGINKHGANVAHGERTTGRLATARVKVPGGWDRAEGAHGTIHRDGRTSAEYQDAALKTGRNLRNVWTIATSPFPEAHFATFPPELAERCIKAGTSERGCCAACGAQWVRITTKGEPDEAHRRASGADSSGGYSGQSTKGHDAAGVQNASDVKRRILEGMRERSHDWSQSCACPPSAPVPCTVLDPFAGAFTAPMVADRLQRHAIGIELNAVYVAMARARIERDAGMFAEIAL